MTVYQDNIILSSASATRIGPQPRHSGCDFSIQNLSETEYVYIGNGQVTTTSFGIRIDPLSGWSVELSQHDTLFAVSGADGVEVSTLRLDLEQGT